MVQFKVGSLFVEVSVLQNTDFWRKYFVLHLQDHARLKYFYSVLLDCVDVCRKEGHKTSSPLEGLPAKSARLTKCIDIASKLTKIAPQMDLKRLLGEAADAPRAAGLPTHSALAEVHATRLSARMIVFP